MKLLARDEAVPSQGRWSSPGAQRIACAAFDDTGNGEALTGPAGLLHILTQGTVEPSPSRRAPSGCVGLFIASAAGWFVLRLEHTEGEGPEETGTDLGTTYRLAQERCRAWEGPNPLEQGIRSVEELASGCVSERRNGDHLWYVPIVDHKWAYQLAADRLFRQWNAYLVDDQTQEPVGGKRALGAGATEFPMSLRQFEAVVFQRTDRISRQMIQAMRATASGLGLSSAVFEGYLDDVLSRAADDDPWIEAMLASARHPAPLPVTRRLRPTAGGTKVSVYEDHCLTVHGRCPVYFDPVQRSLALVV